MVSILVSIRLRLLNPSRTQPKEFFDLERNNFLAVCCHIWYNLAHLLDTADVLKRWRSMEAILLWAVSRFNQAANGRQLPSSFGPRAGDRAVRLQSSDADGAKVKSSC